MLDGMSDPSPPTAPTSNRNPGRLIQALLWPLVAVSGLWLIAAVQALTGISYAWLGVLPRTLIGLPGVVTAPLIHESWTHLLSNTAPLLGLGIIAMYGFPRATRHAVPLIWLLSGIGVWLFGRESFHIGVSGLTHGLMFFVVLMGILRRDALSVALVLVVFLLFGGMASGIIPSEPAISFEYHLFGAIAGVLAAAFLRRVDPLPARIRLSADDADETDPDWADEPASAEPEPDRTDDSRGTRRGD
ncbi:MAG: rhomboid family intramembrane serine protease [Thioalkalivibrio sp.]|nr:rhomboid family intramembrane serine protease [Thioalkalivibrio sp.]